MWQLLIFLLIVTVTFLVTMRLISGLEESPVTVVSGYWKIKSKHSEFKYNKWFENTLSLNAPYVFFYEDEDIKQRVSEIRRDLPTVFIYKKMADFLSAKEYRAIWTHDEHVPTTNLGKIWIEKVNLVRDAASQNPFNSEWFAWVDAGNSYYRDMKPSENAWPNKESLANLPKDKIAYIGTRDEAASHDFAGGAFMYHKSIVQKVHDLFYSQYLACGTEHNDWRCGSDQCVFTQLKNKNPELFHRVGDGDGGDFVKYI